MARDAELRAKITAQDDASKVIEKAAKAAEKFDGETYEAKLGADTKQAERNIAGLLEKADKLASAPATLLLTSNATAIAGDIAGLVIKLDTLDDPHEIKVAADQINKLQGDLDQLEAKIRDVNDTPVDIDTKPAKKGLDDVGKSADSSKSVLANMVGNSTQDLGALGGVAGSAGVAIGQMGEYMADAAGSGDKLGQVVKNFGGVAVPLAAVAIATQAIAGHFAKMAEDEKFATDQMNRFSRSIEDGADSAGVLRKELEDTGKLEFRIQIAGPDIETGDIKDSLAAAGLTLEDFIALTKVSHDEFLAWRDAAEAAGVSGEDLGNIALASAGYFQQNAAATKNAANNNKILGKTYVSEREAILRATLAQKARVEQLEKADEAAAVQDSAKDYAAFAKGMHELALKEQEATDAAKAFNDTIASTDFKATGIQGGIAGMSAFHEQLFGLRDIASQTEAAFDNLDKALEDNGKSFDLNTEKGRANQAAVEDLASAVDLQLAAAFDDADGSFETFNASAETISATLRNKLIKEMGLSEKQADEMLAKLGLLPADIETRYKLSGDEEAKAKIALLQGSIDALPKDVQAKVTQQIIAGDYVGAVQTVQTYFNNHQPKLPTTTEAPDNTGKVVSDAQAYFNRHPLQIPTKVGAPIAVAEGTPSAPWPGALAGEAGPEFIKLPGRPEQLLTHPAHVPPGTRVTSVKRTRAILARRGRLPQMAGGGIAPAGAPIVVPITFQLPTSAEVARRIGPVRIPLFVQANLLADRRINGNL